MFVFQPEGVATFYLCLFVYVCEGVVYNIEYECLHNKDVTGGDDDDDYDRGEEKTEADGG